MSDVKLSFGKCSFRNTSGSWLSAVVTYPFKRVGVSQCFKVKGTTVFPASTAPQINGKMFQSSFDLPDGTILLLQANHRAKGANLRDGAIFIRVREKGPRLLVLAKMVPAMESTLGENMSMFEGCGDILSYEEVVSLGYAPPYSYERNYCNAQEIKECFEVVGFSQGTAPKPELRAVESAKGEVKAIAVAPAPARRMRLGK